MTKELKEKLAKIKASKEIIRKRYHVKKIGIFGSFVRGEQRKKSDIDIVVVLSEPIGFFEFIRLENYLSRKLGRKVDLLTKEGIKPAVKKDILKETIYV